MLVIFHKAYLMWASSNCETDLDDINMIMSY